MTSKIIINKPAADVWSALVNDFAPVDVWMAAITHTEEKTAGQRVPGAPTIGWRAYIGAIPGSYMDETITGFDADTMRFSVHTTLENQSGPLVGFDYTVSAVPVSDTQSELVWDAQAFLKPAGYLLHPVIKKGLTAGFFRGIEEFKVFVETGAPHQRALDNQAKWAKAGII